MAIKIRFHGDTATMRWKNPMEKEFLKQQMTIFRDATPLARISVKDERGREMPRLKPMPMQPIPPVINLCGNSILAGEAITVPPANPLIEVKQEASKVEVVKIEGVAEK